MNYQYRCHGYIGAKKQCWKRLALNKPIEQYKRRPKCPRCGRNDKWFRPKDRLTPARRKTQCHCDVYHYPHTKGMGDCDPNKREQRELNWIAKNRFVD